MILQDDHSITWKLNIIVIIFLSNGCKWFFAYIVLCQCIQIISHIMYYAYNRYYKYGIYGIILWINIVLYNMIHMLT